ncbi:MAG: glycosyltransferase family A protein [Imperialibacter sp.]|uniref:glycosyltransferase family 2 protein n=1 Tax=Imperialibacter sp. TaxID=2038411 RepID=UPI0032EE6FC3
MPTKSESSLALCIPAYNASKYLPTLLGSALKQTIPFDEILVYNDCSTDDTVGVAESFGAKVIKGDTNRGCTYGRKILAESTKCSWIHFHDADDDILPNFTSLAHKWMAMPEPPDVILFNYRWIDLATGDLLATTKFDSMRLEKDPILYSIQVQINPFCGLYHTDSFLSAGGPDLDPLVANNEDVAMHCKLARAGLKFSCDAEFGVINYRVPNSMSRKNAYYRDGVFSQYHVMRKNYEALKEKENAPVYMAAIGEKLWQFARYSSWVSDWKLTGEIVALAVKCGVHYPVKESKIFQTLCKLSPYFAVALREYINRIKRKPNTYWY